MNGSQDLRGNSLFLALIRDVDVTAGRFLKDNGRNTNGKNRTEELELEQKIKITIKLTKILKKKYGNRQASETGHL